MKNQELVDAFGRHRLTVIAGLNLLQDQGVISDNVVWVEDISDESAAEAVKWLDRGRKSSQLEQPMLI